MPRTVKGSSIVEVVQGFRTGTVISSVGATTASTAAATAVGDIQDANLREINNIVLDAADTRAQLNTLIDRLKTNGIISS